jgi:hypothetical protein
MLRFDTGGTAIKERASKEAGDGCIQTMVIAMGVERLFVVPLD